MFSSTTDGVALARNARKELPGILTDTRQFNNVQIDRGRVTATRPDGKQEVLVIGARRYSLDEELHSDMTHIAATRLTTAFEQTGISPGAVFLVLNASGTSLRITVLPKDVIDRMLAIGTVLTMNDTLLMRYPNGFEKIVKENGGHVITFQSSHA
ncbi:hypothetical protein CQ018_10380 [Arthrobacter sp. MYb227]|uniref:hypothetical protein n=1 Tax=Arthrobacter sp. MYb227 TaxID=1848601 RepID=UPI000CFC3361|nr:hypothetical protein [Arthrobacter sp. MYb227]PQZ92877.1 hypothetical protein CQ018_10380 [Arthrobacter sp. MYb227]